MWALSRGYRAVETQPTRSPASRSRERSSASQEEVVSCVEKEKETKKGGVGREKRCKQPCEYKPGSWKMCGVLRGEHLLTDEERLVVNRLRGLREIKR